ncbi:MAG: methyltransferase domain-containing protein [Gaiellaceae bacterium MAG52_C11]|nr:methyltransferase domain-containing protein [Candidatus Gaiellasilicea maunaloa]
MKAYYDTRAPEYDDWWLAEGLHAPAPADWKEERDELIGFLRALPPKRTLDVACGTGFLTRHLQGDVVGLDQSPRMLELAGRYVDVVRGDGVALPFEDDAFERVFTSHFYGHLEEDERARFLAEAERVSVELVVVDAALHGGVERAEWQERELKDGSRWQVYKRFFTPDGLLAELGGGETLFAGRWFVAVRA